MLHRHRPDALDVRDEASRDGSSRPRSARSRTTARPASDAYRRRVDGRITVPVAAEPGSVIAVGRQTKRLHPYCSRSRSSGSPVKASFVFSSPTMIAPPSASIERAARSASTGLDMSCKHSKNVTTSYASTSPAAPASRATKMTLSVTRARLRVRTRELDRCFVDVEAVDAHPRICERDADRRPACPATDIRDTGGRIRKQARMHRWDRRKPLARQQLEVARPVRIADPAAPRRAVRVPWHAPAGAIGVGDLVHQRCQRHRATNRRHRVREAVAVEERLGMSGGQPEPVARRRRRSRSCATLCCSSHSRAYRSAIPALAESSAGVSPSLPASASASYKPSRSPRQIDRMSKNPRIDVFSRSTNASRSASTSPVIGCSLDDGVAAATSAS